MKEPRVQRLVDELNAVVDRLNRLDKLLTSCGVSYHLSRRTREEPFALQDVVQKVDYQ